MAVTEQEASMVINWQRIITSLGGEAVFLAAAAWLIKALVSNRLAREMEEFKIELKASADLEIEKTKAFLVRASRVHERQLDVLQHLYRYLYEALGFFQRQTSSGSYQWEINPEEYGKLVSKALKSAHDELLCGRLLIPKALAQRCDTFFQEVCSGQTTFSIGQDPIMSANPQGRADFLRSAGQVAHTKVPQILEEIEDAARKVIHGEPPRAGS
jgi:hypothetical protein